MANQNIISLKELIKNPEIIKIPTVQRGSVWNARQVEFLWDSIFRGFPIGAFIVRKNNDKSYDLLDGQQRYNALLLGKENSEKAALWFDLKAELPENSTRKFLIKATTPAHPWGYKNDDNCSLLSAEGRRAALQNARYEEGTTIANTPINFKEFKPYGAQFPISLPILISNIFDCKDEKILQTPFGMRSQME